MDQVLGLDVGAWGASVSVVSDGVATSLVGPSSRPRIPSAVSVDASGAVFVSRGAQRRAVLDPSSAVVTPLRLLGRFPGDDAVRRAAAFAPVRIVPGPAGHATVNLADAVYAIPEIAAQLLSYLGAIASRALGHRCRKAVISAPICYGDAQREALILAAKLADLEVVRLISSPVAAAIGHRGRGAVNERWLVVDAGGSQTGAAVIDLRGPVIEVVGLASDASQGALDVDAALRDLLLAEVERSLGDPVSRGSGAAVRLLFAAEGAKRSLLAHDEVRILLRELQLGPRSAVDFDSTVDRVSMEQLVQPYAESVLAVADEAVVSSGVDPGSVERLLVVGGGGALPTVRRELEVLCGVAAEEIKDPDTLIARGAASYGASLVGNAGMSVEGIELLAIDAVSADLSISTAGGHREVVIPSGARLPIAAHRNFTTSRDGQTQVRMLIYQGTRGAAHADCKLGEFVLDGLRSAPRGDICIDVGFELDCDGLLHVSARDPDTGHHTASDVRISLAVAEQALLSVQRARGVRDSTLKRPRPAYPSPPFCEGPGEGGGS